MRTREAVRVPVRGHPPDKDVPVPVGRRSTVADVVRSFLATGAQELLEGKAAIAVSDDAEAVHKARVATRHLRSNLQAFGSGLDAVWLRAVRAELFWLAGSLGAVRDSDVLLERVRRRADELDPYDQPPAIELVSTLEGSTAVARRDLRAVVQSSRFDHLVEQIATGGVSPMMDARPASVVAPLVVAKRWAQLRRSVAALPSDPEAAALHVVRIRVKKCRYSAEAVSPVAGKEAVRLAQALRSLQTILGDLNDSVGSQAWLRQAPQSPAQGVSAGLMIAAEKKEQAALLLAWQKAWAKTNRPKLVGWMPKS